MQPYEKRKKGQSAIEYLTTYGWAILIIGVVIAFLASQGIFSQCQQTAPRFGGQAATIGDAWDFTGTNEVTLRVQATNQQITLHDVLLDYDRDGTYDLTHDAGDDSIAPGNSVEEVIDTGTQFSGGECASMNLAFNVTIDGLSNPSMAVGDGVLQRTVPN